MNIKKLWCWVAGHSPFPYGEKSYVRNNDFVIIKCELIKCRRCGEIKNDAG